MTMVLKFFKNCAILAQKLRIETRKRKNKRENREKH
jgi:hypothetical protein